MLYIDHTDGRLLCTIEIPATRVTSLAFGGPQLDTLYVTTAKEGLSEMELQKNPNSGSVFAVKGLGVYGRIPHNFKLNIWISLQLQMKHRMKFYSNSTYPVICMFTYEILNNLNSVTYILQILRFLVIQIITFFLFSSLFFTFVKAYFKISVRI